MALILSGGDGGNATITGNSSNITITNATSLIVSGQPVVTSPTSNTISVSGNITAGNLLSSGGFYYANGTPFSSGAAATNIDLQQNYGGF
jgi:hypothetical protein